MILGIAGSGRDNANSTRLLAQALTAAAAAGMSESKTYRLADLHFQGCIGCSACRRDAEACVLRDDLTPALQATAAAEALALATPIYYGYATGLFKSYLDRWYAYRDGNRNLRTRPGRPALLILTQGHPDPGAYAWTRESLEKVLTSYGFQPRVLVAAGVDAPGAVSKRSDLISQAWEMGSFLAMERSPAAT